MGPSHGTGHLLDILGLTLLVLHSSCNGGPQKSVFFDPCMWVHARTGLKIEFECTKCFSVVFGSMDPLATLCHT